MSVNNFDYNDFINLVNIKNACDAIFEESIWSYNYYAKISIYGESAAMNCIMRDVAHMLRLVYNYAKPLYSPYDFSKVLASTEIISKVDLKSVYKKFFGEVPNYIMRCYIESKTFCNKLKKYLMNKISELFIGNYCEYEGDQCRDIEATILKEITDLPHEC